MTPWPTVEEVHSCSVKCTSNGKVLSQSAVSLNFHSHHLSAMQHDIEEYLRIKKDIMCSSCFREKMIRPRISANHIFIETQCCEDGKLIASDIKIRLENISLSLQWNEQDYTLRGIIATQGKLKTCTSVGHYFAICHRFAHHWELYDDLKAKKVEVSNSKLVHCQMLLYTL